MTKITTLKIPIKTVSESNTVEHWVKKSNRHKTQKLMVKWAFRQNNVKVNLPCTITMIRIAPRKLDEHDNLRVSMKWIADEVASLITGDLRPGRADDCKEITWKYDQRKGKVKEYAVEILIEEICHS